MSAQLGCCSDGGTEKMPAHVVFRKPTGSKHTSCFWSLLAQDFKAPLNPRVSCDFEFLSLLCTFKPASIEVHVLPSSALSSLLYDLH